MSSDIRPGQIWRDLDPRQSGRTVQVESVLGSLVTVRSTSGRVSRVSVTAFHGDPGRKSGYAHGDPTQAERSADNLKRRHLRQAEAAVAALPQPITCGDCDHWRPSISGLGECLAPAPLWAVAQADRRSIPRDYPAMGCGAAR